MTEETYNKKRIHKSKTKKPKGKRRLEKNIVMQLNSKKIKYDFQK